MTCRSAPSGRCRSSSPRSARATELNDAVHSWGGITLHDIIDDRFARKAIEKGADGLIAVAAGAGGHAGRWSPVRLGPRNPQLVRRAAGPVRARSRPARRCSPAQAMGADLAYIGSPFIATTEARASDEYKQAIVDEQRRRHRLFRPLHRRSRQLSARVDRRGGPRSRRSLGRRRPDAMKFGVGDGSAKAWRDIWGSGQGIGAVDAVHARRRAGRDSWPRNMRRPRRGSAASVRSLPASLASRRESRTGRRVARSTRTWTNSPFGCGAVRAFGENADAIAHARPAKLARPPARLRRGSGKVERRRIGAAGLDHQGDRIALRDVEQALLDQPCVHRAVEPLIEDGIVDVAVGVVVGPARRDASARPGIRSARPAAFALTRRLRTGGARPLR